MQHPTWNQGLGAVFGRPPQANPFSGRPRYRLLHFRAEGRETSPRSHTGHTRRDRELGCHGRPSVAEFPSASGSLYAQWRPARDALRDGSRRARPLRTEILRYSYSFYFLESL